MKVLNAMEAVENLLKSRPELRDDDRALISAIWKMAAENKYGSSTQALSARAFLEDYAAGYYPSAEAIRRSRAKLQEHIPELRGKDYEKRKGGRERSARQEIREYTTRKSFQERLKEEAKIKGINIGDLGEAPTNTAISVSEAARTLSKAGKDKLRMREAMNQEDKGLGQTSLFHKLEADESEEETE